jgi:hypothetical protein
MAVVTDNHFSLVKEPIFCKQIIHKDIILVLKEHGRINARQLYAKLTARS